MTTLVRTATLADLDAVSTSEEVNLGIDAWSPGLIAQGIAGDLPTIVYLVVEVDGEVAGHAVASIVADVVELQRIAVDGPHRRSGLAALLLARVEAEALGAGAARVLLEVREDNAGALGFYAEQGFSELDRRPRYYRDGATAVVMEKPLTGPDAKVCTTS